MIHIYVILGKGNEQLEYLALDSTFSVCYSQPFRYLIFSIRNSYLNYLKLFGLKFLPILLRYQDSTKKPDVISIFFKRLNPKVPLAAVVSRVITSYPNLS